MLPGREREGAYLNELLDRVRAGHSAAIMVRGEAGVGKTALLSEAFRTAPDLRVVRAAGVESEMELPYAGLQQLCVSMLDHLEHLPQPQADALRTAFGLIEGPAPDRFLVGLAVLSLLSEAAAQRPLVCLVDDCQWLDRASAQALAFAARRVQAEGVLLAFAAREPSQDFEGIPRFDVEGLREPDARALLRSVVQWPLDEQVRERILAETRGNPLALLELPRGLSPAELAGGFGLPQALSHDHSLAGRIQESFLRRVEVLPEASRLMVLLAAAEPMGDPALMWRAAARLGLARDAVVSAKDAGLLKIGGQVVFRHPLVRSAVYGASAPGDRRRVHVALAAATDPDLDPDRRAWHLAQAASGPDEEVAAELEWSAARAQARGGLAAAAAFLDRAVQLSLDPAAQARRALAAAHATYLAGAPEAARRLLSTAEAGPVGELERSQVDMIRAQIAYSQNRGSDAPPLLLRAARRLEPLNLRMARQTCLDAVLAGHFAGRLAPGSLREAAEAARRVPHLDGPPAASDLLLDGLATALTSGYAVGVATLKQAVRAFRGPAATLDEQLRWLWPAAHVAMALWDDESYDLLSARHIEIAREAGVLAVLPTALTTRIVSCAFAGQLSAADQLIEEMRALTDAMGTPAPAYGPVFVSAWRGQEDTASKVIDAAVRDFTLSGEGAVLAFADYARAVLCNGLGRYPDALAAAAATDAFEVEGVTIYTQGLAELVEAATRVGAAERAADALARLEEMTGASDTDWGAGIRARSQALVSTDAAAEPLYREAVERLGRTRIRPQLARAHLVYGEWLRREGRRVDARRELLQAFEMFADMGMDAFSERTRRELAATGEKIRAQAADRPHDLTSQEAQIARLAREGLTNAEIGFQLYLSARTVEWHLRKVFVKLGITSRRQLHTAALLARTRRVSRPTARARGPGTVPNGCHKPARCLVSACESESERTEDDMRTILVVGGGYAGFYTAWKLEKKLRRGEARVIVVDPRPYMTYQPFLPEVLAGSVEARHAAVSLRRHLRKATVIAGSVTAIDHANRTATVRPAVGPAFPVGYDIVVVTAGAVTRKLAIPGVAEHAIGMKHVEEAVAIRDRLLTAFDQASALEPGPLRRRLLTVTFVGGGFSGVEGFGELLSLATSLLRSYPGLSPAELNFHLVEARDRILPEVSDRPGRWVVRSLEKRGARVHLNAELLSARNGHLVLSTGAEFDSELIVWTVGNSANPMVRSHTDLPIDQSGMLTVRADLRVGTGTGPGAAPVPGAWGAGDAAAVPDLAARRPGAATVPSVQPNAQNAVRQGKLLARNIVATLRGRKPKPYLHRSLGTIATLGIGRGIFQYRGLVIKGFPAWLMHRGYHVLAVPTWERKIRVLAVWCTAALFGRDIVSLASVQHPREAFLADAELTFASPGVPVNA